MLGKKLVTAQKRGETRALCLGLGMVACSMMMYFFIGITIVPSYTKSVWTTETVCKVLKANIKDKVHCSQSEDSEDENVSHYPCLQVWVNLTASGQEVMLYQTEDTLERDPKCSYVPGNSENPKEVKTRIETIASNFKRYQTFPCYYDPGGTQTNVILSRLYPPKGLLFAFLWPTLLFTGGCLIILLSTSRLPPDKGRTYDFSCILHLTGTWDTTNTSLFITQLVNQSVAIVHRKISDLRYKLKSKL